MHAPRRSPASNRHRPPTRRGLRSFATIFQFVKLAAVLNELPNPDEATYRALAAVEMDPHLDRPMGTFSKGMRQRAKIASAIVHDPSVLFLDEPLNGLDPKQRRHMISLFHSLGEAGRTVLVSSHVLDEVDRFGSRVLVIANGRLAAQGDFHAIRALMDDQPLRYRIVCSDSRHFAAHLMARGATVGTTLLDRHTFELTTLDALSLRRTVAVVAKEVNVRLFEVSPLDADLESVFRYLVGGSQS
ncbi:MAG: ABC transporter ATP-binding protein [Acidimicrobiales bacterium]